MNRTDEINLELSKRIEMDLSSVEVFYIFSLIEEKILLITEEQDLHSFSYSIKKLPLSSNDKSRLVSIRNKMVHSREIAENEINQNIDWIKTNIIPIVIDFKKEQFLESPITELELINQIQEKIEKCGFRILREFAISIGTRHAIADFLLETPKIKIIGEVKSSKSTEKSISIQQLQSYLAATNLSHGVLILPYAINERFEKQITDYLTIKILIIGAFDDFTILKEWIQEQESLIDN